MTLEELERRVRVLEDVEAIKKLKARYCACCDDGFDPDGIAELFTEDGVWESAGFGSYRGRAAIRSFFEAGPSVFPFTIHQVMNPIIEVEGDTAKGSWYLFQTCTFADGNQAVWGAARYQEDYVRQNGEWKFKNLKVVSSFWTPFDQGWVKKQFVQEK